MHESKKSKVIFTHKKIKQFRRWHFCSYNKLFGLFSVLLMLKKINFWKFRKHGVHLCKDLLHCSVFQHAISHIKKENILWEQDWHILIFISLPISVLPEVFDLSHMMKNDKKHLPCPVYKIAIKLPYEVITLTFHSLFKFKHELSTLNTQYNGYLYKTWRNQRYS